MSTSVQAAVPKTIAIPMRDGIKLAAELYLPGSGSYPTLIRKTPYDRRRESILPEIDGFVAAGYAVVIASFRGRMGSEGSFHPWRSEAWTDHEDGYDTIEWAATQEWSTGAVGTYGVSADGQCQITTAPTRPPHLKAMVVSYGADPRVGIMNGGAITSTGPQWYDKQQTFSLPLQTVDEWRRWLGQWRDTKLPLLASFVHPALMEPLHYAEDEDFWRDIDAAAKHDEFDVPVLYECGWYDRYTSSQFAHFSGVREKARSERARGGQRLISGPWVHGGPLSPENDEVTYGEAAIIDRVEMHVRWFDFWLKGDDNGVADEASLKLYVLGADEWHECDQWPPTGDVRAYFLRAGDGGGSGSLNDGRLELEAPAQEAPDEYDHDPYDPLPTIGGHGGTGWIWPAGALDQRPVEARSLTYTTEPLAEELRVVGEPTVRLHASSSAVDTDFVLTLCRVHPSGYSEPLQQRIVRARYRDGYTRPQLLEPGRVHELEISLGEIAFAIAPGERLRLTIASSSFPAVIPNAGTDEPIHLATSAVTARNSIHHDSERPSQLLLPIVSPS